MTCTVSSLWFFYNFFLFYCIIFYFLYLPILSFRVSKLQVSIHNVRFPPLVLVLAPHLLIFVVKANASGLPHVLKLWLGVSDVLLPVKYFCSNKTSFCVNCVSWRSYSCH